MAQLKMAMHLFKRKWPSKGVILLGSVALLE